MARVRLWITACWLSTALAMTVAAQPAPPSPQPPPPPRPQPFPADDTPAAALPKPMPPKPGPPSISDTLPIPAPAVVPPGQPRPPAAPAPPNTDQAGRPQASPGPTPPNRPVRPPARLSTRPATAQPTLTMAIPGSPYGIGRIEIPLAEPLPAGDAPPLEITDDDRRILYPIAREIHIDRLPRGPEPVAGEPLVGGGRLMRRLGNLVREINGDTRPLAIAREVTFLFHGDAPLRIRLSEPDVAGRTELLVTPTVAASPTTHAEMLAQWWQGYTAALQQQIALGDYPPIIENYLIALLSGRLNLPLPEDFAAAEGAGDASIWSILKLLAGAQEVRDEVLRRAATGLNGPVELASLPLPAAPVWDEAPPPQPAGEIAIEPTADRVPPECFYVRFGSFANYLWIRDLANEFGGDVSRMITLRSLTDNSAQRIENQLWLKMSDLSRVLGNSVIEDQALIGRDLFLTEGASLGILFRARNTFLLRTSLEGDRAALLRSDPAVTQSTERILDQDVSLISTPDNRVRSFLVVDGEYIFVSNSRTLIERFLEVGRDGQSLGKTAEFRLARQFVPLGRNDTVFAYFSPQMLAGLVSPEYLIEMRRRIESQADMSLLGLARLASAAESQPLQEIDDLIEAGFLPVGFGKRADGSGLVAVGDTIVDSLRGARGTLLPIVDAPPTKVTPEEDAWYRQIADFHNSEWRQMDPVFVGLRRSTSPDSPAVERLEAHGEIAPWSPEKYGKIAKQLGPPTKLKIDFAPDDVVAAQAHVVSDQLAGAIPPHHLFAAIKDAALPDPKDFGGILSAFGALRQLPGYIGAWPFPGLIDRLPLGIGRGQPVGPGMTRLIGGLYRFQGGGFSILSFQREILEASLPHIVADEAPDEAQVRVRAATLQGTKIESWVNQQFYERAARASRAGSDLLGLVTRQLKVDREAAPQVVGELLSGTLQDSLGGEYQLLVDERSPTATKRWVSTAWGGSFSPPASPPPGYEAPPLLWFRGGSANLTQLADRVIVDAVIDVQRASDNR